jgi:hypothetical protein
MSLKNEYFLSILSIFLLSDNTTLNLLEVKIDRTASRALNLTLSSLPFLICSNSFIVIVLIVKSAYGLIRPS